MIGIIETVPAPFSLVLTFAEIRTSRQEFPSFFAQGGGVELVLWGASWCYSVEPCIRL